MENKSHAFVAGLFTIGFLIGIVFFALWLSRDTVAQREFYIETQESITGLNPQARVNFKGIRVGRVTDISFDKARIGTVRITIRVEETTPINSNTSAQLKTQGLTGQAFIELYNSGEDNGTLAQFNPNAPIPLSRGGSLEDIAKQSSELLANANGVLVELKALMQPDNKAGVPALVGELKQTAQSTREVIDGVLPAIQKIDPLMQNLTEASQSVVRITSHVDGVVQQLTGKEGAIAQVSAIVSTANQMMADLSLETVPKLNLMIESASNASKDAGIVFQQLKTNPQSLIFGVERSPGPGETGFKGF